MDKRTLLGIKTIIYQNKKVDVYVYLKKNGYGVTLRFLYGCVEAYITKRITDTALDKFVIKGLQKYPDRVVDCPFYIENNYIYVLGEKKYITRDIRYKNNSNYFYVKSTCKNVINVYRKLFIKYLYERIAILGKIMNLDLTNFKIYSDLFLSYYGCCFPTKRQIKFDYRLFAYKTYISDAIIIHELAHLIELSHSNDFYNVVYKYCPNYDKLSLLLKEGKFDGK